MRRVRAGLVFSIVLLANICWAQEPKSRKSDLAEPAADTSPENIKDSILAFAPPSLDALARRASVSNSFILDRTTLRAMQALFSGAEDGAGPAIRKLDGISVRLYRFRDLGETDQARLEEVRTAYSSRGWKHLVSKGIADSLHKRTDLWLTFDGMDVRGGAMMLVTPKSVSLVTFAGDLNPVDVLRLRGHFGIPAADSDRP